MELVEYNEISETSTIIKKEAIFISENLNNFKSFEKIIDKFYDYRFTEHIGFLRNDHDCQSRSSILFSIIFKNKVGEIRKSLFRAKLEIFNRTEIDYIPSSMCDDVRDIEFDVDRCLMSKRCDEVLLKAQMKIKFYKNRSLDILDQDEESDNDEYSNADEPAIVESSFTSDNCSVCLSKKPNILNIPCLHLAICCSCEEAGYLLRCVVCRKRIVRKIKI